MIAVDKRGGLGNQMFQYAFGVAAARRLGTFFAYDTTELERYFRLLGPKPLRAATRLAVRIFDERRGLERREVVADDREEPDEILQSLSDKTFYGGHFYSEGFFHPAAARVRTAFRIREAHLRRFQGKYSSLVTSGYVCAHVRLTDFFSYRDDVTLPPGYYQRALDALDNDLPVIIVSDDPERVRLAFESNPRIRVEANDEIVDFLLLKHAKRVISSNSSFAWWAAWLNETPGLRVIAPQWWLGLHSRCELPIRAIPEQWERIEPRVQGDGEWPQP
jgi:hypothetical protein